MKTTTEWRTEFDLLYNNLLSNQAPSLNDYEVSVLLTQAQEEIVITLYSGRRLQPFESTEEVKEYLSPLVKQVVLEPASNIAETAKINLDSYFFQLPEDLLFKTFEKATIANNTLLCKGSAEREVNVVPITQDEYDRTVENPFKRSNERRVLSLLSGNRTSELISRYPVINYTVRYVKKPRPIILSNLAGTGLSINGETAERTCELHEGIHRSILSRAVELGKSIWLNTSQQTS